MCAQASISIRISPEFSADKAASGLEVVVPMPREVQRVNCENLKPSQARQQPRCCTPVRLATAAVLLLWSQPWLAAIVFSQGSSLHPSSLSGQALHFLAAFRHKRHCF